jgi:hypothetical protein
MSGDVQQHDEKATALRQRAGRLQNLSFAALLVLGVVYLFLPDRAVTPCISSSGSFSSPAACSISACSPTCGGVTGKPDRRLSGNARGCG